MKNLWAKRTRSVLALLGLSVAIVGVIGLISISSGIRFSILEAFSKMQGVYVLQKDVFIPTQSVVLAKHEARIASIPEVSAVSPEVWGVAGSVDGKSAMESGFSSFLGVIGMDPEKTNQLKGGGLYKQNLKKGRFLKSGDRYVAVISKSVSEKFKKPVGSRIEIDSTKFTIAGIFETGSADLDNHVIVPIDTARAFIGRDKDHVTGFFVEVRSPSDADRVAKKIELMLDDVSAKTTSQYSKELGSLVNMLDVFFLAISAVAIIVGAIGILNTMLMSVMERIKEFGILRAVGWTREDVMKLVMFESLYLGIIGGVLGMALGYSASVVLGWVMPFKPIATAELLASGFLLSIILGVGGGIYPAWRASKLDPITAIRYG